MDLRLTEKLILQGKIYFILTNKYIVYNIEQKLDFLKNTVQN